MPMNKELNGETLVINWELKIDVQVGKETMEFSQLSDRIKWVVINKIANEIDYVGSKAGMFPVKILDGKGFVE
jgi:hypothetical protein